MIQSMTRFSGIFQTVLERKNRKSAVPSQEYRDAMSHFAGAVHVVTTDGAAGRRGLTVSAAVSVSDNPPTLIVCLNRNRDENRLFAENGCFAVNTLCDDQLELARAFAGEGHLPMEARFALGKWTELETGAPVLLGSRMTVDCVVTDVQAVHTHHVVFGEVVATGPAGQRPALLYLDRQYRTV